MPSPFIPCFSHKVIWGDLKKLHELGLRNWVTIVNDLALQCKIIRNVTDVNNFKTPCKTIVPRIDFTHACMKVVISIGGGDPMPDFERARPSNTCALRSCSRYWNEIREIVNCNQCKCRKIFEMLMSVITVTGNCDDDTFLFIFVYAFVLKKHFTVTVLLAARFVLICNLINALGLVIVVWW